jgi:hypothetical protein
METAPWPPELGAALLPLGLLIWRLFGRDRIVRAAVVVRRCASWCGKHEVAV